MKQGFYFGTGKSEQYKNGLQAVSPKSANVSKQNNFRLPYVIERILPLGITDAACDVVSSTNGVIEEIRLRAGRYMSFTAEGKNILYPLIFTEEELANILKDMCSGSLYTYEDSINEGFVTLKGGVRVGIGGRATCKNGKITGINDISSLSIRLPRDSTNAGEEICRLLNDFSMTRGILIYSPPGVGKTTLLKGVSVKLSSGYSARRAVIIDSRGELEIDGVSELCLDILSGYPKGTGIEIASRTLNAEVIICDEIGNSAEAAAIISAHNCGVPLIATAHADNIKELLSKPGIRALHRAGIFGAYVRIRRDGHGGFIYDITNSEEAYDGI